MKYNGIDTDKIMRNGERVRGRLNGKDLETGIITDGLVLWLDGEDFSNSPPTTTWTDRSGQGNDGTASGFAYTGESGSDGNSAIVFDGVDDKAVVGITNNGLGDFTWEVKINASNLVGNPTTGFSIMSTTSFSPAIIIAKSTNLLGIYSKGQKSFGIQLFVDTDYHIIVSRENGSVKCFVNNLECPFTVELPLMVMNNNIFIGNAGSTNDYFNGKVYFARAYNKALSEYERQQNYLASQ